MRRTSLLYSIIVKINIERMDWYLLILPYMVQSPIMKRTNRYHPIIYDADPSWNWLRLYISFLSRSAKRSGQSPTGLILTGYPFPGSRSG